MRRFVRFVVVPSVLALVLASWAFPAEATHNADRHDKMDLLFTSPNSRINSDLAFWGKYAVHGYYRNDQAVGGFRIFDISNPAAPQQLMDFPCDGLQADPVLWDRDNDAIPDLLLLAVDRTMAGPQCGAARAAHDDPVPIDDALDADLSRPEEPDHRVAPARSSSRKRLTA